VVSSGLGRYGQPYVTNLATGRLGEPQRPSVGERVLDIEVVLVVEDSLNVCRVVNVRRGPVTAIWRYGNGGEVDLLRHDVRRLVKHRVLEQVRGRG
jgi:hypothetical protein